MTKICFWTFGIFLWYLSKALAGRHIFLIAHGLILPHIKRNDLAFFYESIQDVLADPKQSMSFHHRDVIPDIWNLLYNLI